MIFKFIFAGEKDVLLVLLEEGASLNIADTNGNTPLLLAVKAGNLQMVQILLHAGANPYHEQGSVTVAQVALESSNKNIVYIFEHLDFSTAIPDWTETRSEKRPIPKSSFFRPPIAFDPNPPAKVQMTLQGNEKTNKKLLDAAKNGRPIQVRTLNNNALPLFRATLQNMLLFTGIVHCRIPWRMRNDIFSIIPRIQIFQSTS